MYNNLKEILDKDKGAAVIDLKIFGQSSFGEMVNNPADNKIIENEKPFMSSNHVYSVIKLTDDYAYLQESNNPKYYIRITKEQFLNSLLNVATWQFD